MSHIVSLSASKVTDLECLQRAIEHIKGVELTYVDGIARNINTAGPLKVKCPGVVGVIEVKGRVRVSLRLDKKSEDATLISGKIHGNALTFQGDSDNVNLIDAVFGKGCKRLIDYYNREVAMKTTQSIYGQEVELKETEVAGMIGLTAILN